MKFYKIVFIYIIVQLFCSPFVFSSENQAAVSATDEEIKKVKKDLDAGYEAWAEESRRNYEPGWDDKIQDVQIRANGLLIDNERLAREQESLLEEYARLKAEVDAQKTANAALRVKIQEKRGLIEDKRWRDRANAQIKELEKTLEEKTKELDGYDRKLGSLDKKTELARMKLIGLGLDIGPVEEKIKAADEIERLRVEIAAAEDRQRVLRYQRDQLSDSKDPIDPKVLALNEEIAALDAKIAAAQKAGAEPTVEAPDEMAELNRQKEDLQKENDRLKAEVDKIEHAQEMGIANERVKEIVDEMGTIERENAELREEMEALKENIIILRTHVKKLEYQTEAINAMKGNFKQMENLQIHSK